MVKLGLTYRLSSTFILVAFHLTYEIPGCCVHVPRDEEQAEVGHPQEFQFLNSFFFFPDLLDPHNKLCTSDGQRQQLQYVLSFIEGPKPSNTPTGLTMSVTSGLRALQRGRVCTGAVQNKK